MRSKEQKRDGGEEERQEGGGFRAYIPDRRSFIEESKEVRATAAEN